MGKTKTTPEWKAYKAKHGSKERVLFTYELDFHIMGFSRRYHTIVHAHTITEAKAEAKRLHQKHFYRPMIFTKVYKVKRLSHTSQQPF